MISLSELDRMRAIDISKTAFMIGNACRSQTLHMDESVYAAAYVLMKSLEDYQISVDSMDYYFQTAKESETWELFIRQALEGCRDSIRELKYKFSTEEFKALLLFYNGNASKGWDSAAPAGVAQLGGQASQREARHAGAGYRNRNRQLYSRMQRSGACRFLCRDRA